MSKFEANLEVQAELADLRQALKTAQVQEARAKRKSRDIVDAVYRAAKDSSVAVGRGQQTPPKKDPRKAKAEVALVHATDWQLGKKTVSYGISTCAQRMKQLTDKVVQLTTIQRAHHPVKNCVLMLGGDMVEGVSIFPGQAYEIEAFLFEQLFEASKVMETMIRDLAANFEKVHVVCEFGNHGRLGRKGDMPDGDNIDRMAYEITRQRVTDLKNLTWQASEDWYQIVEIGSYRALLIHGDEVGSFSALARKVNGWAAGVVEPFNDCYVGHFHTPTSLTMANSGRVFVTGSPESNNEYARKVCTAVGKPSQRVHFVDPDKGRVTAEYVVFLD